MLDPDEEAPDPVVELDVVLTVGVATLVPEPEDDPVDAAKAFPDTRSPTRTVAIPAFPTTMEMDFLDSLRIRLTPCLRVNL